MNMLKCNNAFLNSRLKKRCLKNKIERSKTHGLILLVMLAVLIQVIFHEADVHYQSTDVVAHSCVFHQSDVDPIPPFILLILLGVYKTYQRIRSNSQVWVAFSAFIQPQLRAPPLYSVR